MNDYARELFQHIDIELNRYTKQVRNRVFSEYRDMPWTKEQYRALAPIIREELDNLVASILGKCDNWGCVLEGDVLGYSIYALPGDERPSPVPGLNELVLLDLVNISDGDLPYREMWLQYLEERRSSGQV